MATRFGPGKRVRITGDHPWTGRRGTVVEFMEVAGAKGWSVEVDGTGGIRSFVVPRKLRRVGK